MEWEGEGGQVDLEYHGSQTEQDLLTGFEYEKTDES
jgi:hypothetical protein